LIRRLSKFRRKRVLSVTALSFITFITKTFL